MLPPDMCDLRRVPAAPAGNRAETGRSARLWFPAPRTDMNIQHSSGARTGRTHKPSGPGTPRRGSEGATSLRSPRPWPRARRRGWGRRDTRPAALHSPECGAAGPPNPGRPWGGGEDEGRRQGGNDHPANVPSSQLTGAAALRAQHDGSRSSQARAVPATRLRHRPQRGARRESPPPTL